MPKFASSTEKIGTVNVIWQIYKNLLELYQIQWTQWTLNLAECHHFLGHPTKIIEDYIKTHFTLLYQIILIEINFFLQDIFKKISLDQQRYTHYLSKVTKLLS